MLALFELRVNRATISPSKESLKFSKENTCLKLTSDRQLVIDSEPIPICGRNEVLVHIKCTGICGSDIHVWKAGGIGNLQLKSDLILGHECSGEIIHIGSEVTEDFEIGNKVAIEPQLPCGICFLCTNGNMNLCLNVDFMGMPGMPGRLPSIHGSIQRYKTLDPRFVYKLPDNVTYEEGALVEVLSVGYHGIQKAGGLELGKPCAIAGCGPIGLATLILAEAAGAYPIVVTDVSQEKLNFAKSLVPSVYTYKVQTNLSPKESAENVRKLFGKTEYEMPSVVLECTGVASSINTCAYIVRRKGCLTILGVSGRNEIDGFPFMQLSFGEVDVRFINRYHDSWPPVINLIASGKIDVKKFVTHTFPLEKAHVALETVSNPAISLSLIHI